MMLRSSAGSCRTAHTNFQARFRRTLQLHCEVHDAQEINIGKNESTTNLLAAVTKLVVQGECMIQMFILSSIPHVPHDIQAQVPHLDRPELCQLRIYCLTRPDAAIRSNMGI
eukprot:jgi/Ulvmu1/5245/UM022_0038.1